MEKTIYTQEEHNLIQGALIAQALQTKADLLKAIELDLLLLDMEAQQGLQDGLPMEGYLL